jgi:hypothetical protein
MGPERDLREISLKLRTPYILTEASLPNVKPINLKAEEGEDNSCEYFNLGQSPHVKLA